MNQEFTAENLPSIPRFPIFLMFFAVMKDLTDLVSGIFLATGIFAVIGIVLSFFLNGFYFFILFIRHPMGHSMRHYVRNGWFVADWIPVLSTILPATTVSVFRGYRKEKKAAQKVRNQALAEAQQAIGEQMAASMAYEEAALQYQMMEIEAENQEILDLRNQREALQAAA